MTDLLLPDLPSPLQKLHYPAFEAAGIEVWIKRDDLIHPTVSGNKWRKLKYLLLDAKSHSAKRILTFGGAYSNHLYAVAAAGKLLDFETIGIVRGEDAQLNESTTLKFCREQGMQLHFTDRATYKLKDSAEYFSSISTKFNQPYIIPEGGTTHFALKGVSEMVGEVGEQLGGLPDYFACAAGTGGTAAGIIAAGAKLLAFPALKGGGFLEREILALAGENISGSSLKLFPDYHFGGYAKWNTELLDFMDFFKEEFGIQLEQVYTAKMLWGLFDLIKKGYFQPGTRIVAVHTGGLQGLIRR